MKTEKLIRIPATLLTALLACLLFALCAAAGELPEPLSYALPLEGHTVSVTDDVGALDNEMILMAAPGTKPGRVAALVAPYGGEIVGRIDKADMYQIRFGQSFSAEALGRLCGRLERSPAVEYAQLHTLSRQISQSYNVGDLWRQDLKNSTDRQGKSWYLELMDIPAAWDWMDRYTDPYPQKVGLADTGFWPHEDIQFQEVYNLKAYGYEDAYVHGTMCAGIFAAKSKNAQGIMGVYPYGDDYLYGFSMTGWSRDHENDGSDYGFCYGIGWLLERGARVINVSMGDMSIAYQHYYRYVKNDSGAADRTYADDMAIARLEGAFLQRYLDWGYDFVIVTAAGNFSNTSYPIQIDGNDINVDINMWTDAAQGGPLNRIRWEDYPDVYNRIIVVGSLRDADNVSDFSCVDDRVDVYVPGEDILCTTPVDGANTPSQTAYGYATGTSAASPIVAGIAANILTVNPWLGGDDVKDMIRYIAEPYQNQNGFPRNPNVVTALNMANNIRNELALGIKNEYGINLRPRRGDVDRNGRVTTADARLALRQAIGLEQFNPYSVYYHQADADRDEKITTTDARIILRVAVGLETLSLKY